MVPTKSLSFTQEQLEVLCDALLVVNIFPNNYTKEQRAVQDKLYYRLEKAANKLNDA